MPSARSSRRLGLWVRVVAACLVVATVGTALVAFEAAVIAAASYGALTVLFGVAAALVPTEPVALLAAVVAYLAVVTVVGAAYRVERRGAFEGVATRGLLVYAGFAMAGGSLAVTLLAMSALGAPRWAYGVLVVVILAGIYPTVGLLLARERDPDSDDPPWGSTDIETEEPLPWRTDDERPYETPSPRETVRGFVGNARAGSRAAAEGLSRLADAVGGELGAVAGAARARLGPTGTVGTVGLVVVALAGVAVAARTRSAGALVRPLAVGLGVLFAVGHAADVVVAARRDEAVVDGLVEDLGPGVDGDRVRAVEDRVSRLAAAMDVPAPTVRLRRSETPTAAVVGYDPAESTLVVSTGLVEALSDRELDAVLAHELAHVANRDAAVLTALSFPRTAGREAFYRYGPNPVAVLLAGVASATSRLCVAVVSRAREHTADDAAAAVTGDPAAMASALERLDDRVAGRPNEDLRAVAAPFSVVPPAWEEHRFFDRTRRLLFRRLLGTHPPTERRIERLRRLADGE